MIDARIQAWIKTNEGLKLDAYVDTTGHLTIGYGRNLENGITLDEAELMFQNDLKRSLDELQQYDWYNNAPQNVKDALINMNFNLGISKLLGFKKMIVALNEKNYRKAAMEALDSRWSKQLPNRSKEVVVMMGG